MSDIKVNIIWTLLSHLQFIDIEKGGNSLSYQKSIRTYQTTIGDWIKINY